MDQHASLLPPSPVMLPGAALPRAAPAPATVTRRDFVKAVGVVSAVGALGGLGAAATARPSLARAAHVAGSDGLRLGVIGCGGRGSGAAIDALTAEPGVTLHALADLFPDRLNSSRDALAKHETFGPRATVPAERCFTGFDAYQKLLAIPEIDVVVLATPPHFRPVHFEAAVNAGKHVFMEKPVAVDPAGVRRVLAAAASARGRGLCVVAGTQRRHEAKYLELMKRVRDGAVGTIVAANCWWNQGGLWDHARKPEYSDVEWQLRNWLYFAWTSGDHIVEQHVHNIDVVNWAMGKHPVRARGMGGRQARTHEKYGHVFDHFAVQFEYDDGTILNSQCRQIDGSANRVDEMLVGSQGVVRCGAGEITGKNAYKHPRENQPNPYEVEHRDLFAAIRAGKAVDEATAVAESTLTAIMGRLSAYSGQEVTWDQALAMDLDLSPATYEFGPLPVPPVAIPGQYKLPGPVAGMGK